jgi:hypothetical protein
MKAEKFWAWLPALLLGAMFVGLGTMAYVAIDDPHFALEPNYYDKAIHWDDAQARAQSSSKTGLSAELAPLAIGQGGDVSVELRLSDREARPVAGAVVALEAFPNAYASRVQRLLLQETAPGVYRGNLRGAAVGLWELRLSATQGALRFQQVLRRDVARKDAA